MNEMTDEQMEAMAPGEYTAWEKRVWRRGYEAGAAAPSAPQGGEESEPFAYVVCDGADATECADLQWPRQIRRGPRGARAAWRDLPPGTHPLYLHTAAQQPPAETQAQGGREVDDGSADASVWTLIALMERVGGERDSGEEGDFITMTLRQVYALEALLTARGHDPGWVDTTPPSAPVGVEAATHWHDLYRQECRLRQDDAARYGKQIADLESALAQQPAAVDGAAWSGWSTQYPGEMPKLYGAEEIARLNWHPFDGQDLIRVAEVERVSAAEWFASRQQGATHDQ